MALELFNTAAKNDVYNNWYPEDSRAYVKFIVGETQQKLGTNDNSKILRKDEIKLIVKHFGKPHHITDDDYIDYVNRLKLLGEW